MLKRGFTLIELLIVIAVLGILAVAVLAAINPIEQINRSYDTGSRSDSEQLISAIDRYYASTEGTYPWQTTTSSSNVLDWVTVDTAWTDDASPGVSVLSKLSEAGGTGTGELKQSFINKVDKAKNPLIIHNDGGTGDSTYVCFKAISNSFKTQAAARCTDGLPSDLTSQVNTICNATGDIYYSCLP